MVLKSTIAPPPESDLFEAMSNSQFSNRYYADQILCHPLQILPSGMFQSAKSQGNSGFHHSSNLMMGSSQKVDSVYVPESISPWSEIITKYLNGTAPSQRKHYKSRSSYHNHHHHHHHHHQQQHHLHHLHQQQQHQQQQQQQNQQQQQQQQHYDQLQQMHQVKRSGPNRNMGQTSWDKLEGINAYPVQRNVPMKPASSSGLTCFSPPPPPPLSKYSAMTPKFTNNNLYQGTSSNSYTPCQPAQTPSFVSKTSSMPSSIDQRSMIAPSQLTVSSSTPTSPSPSASSTAATAASTALNVPTKDEEDFDSISEMTNANRFTIEYESIQEAEDNYKELVEREWKQSRGPQSGPSDSMMNGMIRELLNSTHEDDGSICESLSVATHFSNDEEISDLKTVNALCQR